VRLGPYRLLEVLGQGHMGIVFRARRETDGESVALKVLRDELAKDKLYRRRFQREARIASELVDEHVVPVIDFGEASGHLYIAARYVRGAPLSERIASEGALSLSEALRLVSDIAGALEALHARGLVHRDVKPANVMVDERGAAALTDFGLARGVAETVLTKTGMVVGTVDYLAPELIRGEQADRSSDVYALGCLLYECLAGAPPFADRAYVETLLAHVRDEPPDLGDLRADLPESVSWTVQKALAKDPAQRPKSAAAYARLLRASAQAG
jgi:serine/threonine protein kinase